MLIDEADEVRKIACQEVRGGNLRAAYEAELPGLTGWISCQPVAPSPGGGDVYYMSACGKGAMARVVLADVAGHGEGGWLPPARRAIPFGGIGGSWAQSPLSRQWKTTFSSASRGTC